MQDDDSQRGSKSDYTRDFFNRKRRRQKTSMPQARTVLPAVETNTTKEYDIQESGTGDCHQETIVETVTVEFFGVPRQRAARAELVVPAGTIAETLVAVGRSCPGLADLVQAGGRLAPYYALSLNGQRFLRDLDVRLTHGDRLLLLSADAGG